MLERGLCTKHPHPEWWTTSDYTDLIPVKARRQTASGRWRTRIHNTTPQWRAKRICEECPVKKECLQLVDILEGQAYRQGLASHVCGGVWGGEGPAERAQRRRGQLGAA